MRAGVQHDIMAVERSSSSSTVCSELPQSATGCQLSGTSIRREARRRFVTWVLTPAGADGGFGLCELDAGLSRLTHPSSSPCSNSEMSLFCHRPCSPARVGRAPGATRRAGLRTRSNPDPRCGALFEATGAFRRSAPSEPDCPYCDCFCLGIRWEAESTSIRAHICPAHQRCNRLLDGAMPGRALLTMAQ